MWMYLFPYLFQDAYYGYAEIDYLTQGFYP